VAAPQTNLRVHWPQLDLTKKLMRAGLDAGCAFVVMTKRKDGAAAIAALHATHTLPGWCLRAQRAHSDPIHRLVTPPL
jgi:hypothetical protein